jgi:hypothetical protein
MGHDAENASIYYSGFPLAAPVASFLRANGAHPWASGREVARMNAEVGRRSLITDGVGHPKVSSHQEAKASMLTETNLSQLPAATGPRLLENRNPFLRWDNP